MATGRQLTLQRVQEVSSGPPNVNKRTKDKVTFSCGWNAKTATKKGSTVFVSFIIYDYPIKTTTRCPFCELTLKEAERKLILEFSIWYFEIEYPMGVTFY